MVFVHWERITCNDVILSKLGTQRSYLNVYFIINKKKESILKKFNEDNNVVDYKNITE